MRRCFSPRTVTVMMGVAWLLSPSAIFAQVVHVQPYVQPGDGHSLTGSDVKVIQWLTDQTPGFFIVEYFEKGGPVHFARPSRIPLDFFLPPPMTKPKMPDKSKDKDKDKDKDEPKKDDTDPDAPKEPKEKEPKEKIPPAPEKNQHFLRYTAKLDSLPFNSEITYRVKLGSQIIREATFKTRSTEDRTVRCVLVGDMAEGRKAQKEVAYRLSLEKPEFLVALGDMVYPTGRVNQYTAYFWDTYNNVSQPGIATGAPLMAEVPFYPVLGNHDVRAKLNRRTPDALAVYLFFNPPKNGPGEGPWNTVLDPTEAVYEQFRAATVDSFPYIDTYSFDNGPAHFVVINTNRPLNLPIFQKWLIEDLKSTKAKWKIVCFHIPGFQSSRVHYSEQQVRALQPIFEEYGVDLTFAGHVHNYQRSMPLKFLPKAEEKGKGRDALKYLINGVFTLDTNFDGIKNTQPDGVIHIVAGGGGAGLYGPDLKKTAESLKKTYGPDNYADFTARMVVDQYSFVVLDMSPYRLDLRAMGWKGNEIDRITITKDQAKIK